MQTIRIARLLALITVGSVLQNESRFALAEQAIVSFDTSVEGKMPIKIGDQQVAVYVYQDDEISRPYFAHLRAPGAPQVSRNHPPIAGKDRADHGTFHPSWFHARDYGLLEANPFGREAFGKGEKSKVPVKPGESFRLRYGVFVHASPTGDAPDLAAAYADYLRVVSE